MSHAAYMREWRKTHPLTGEARLRDIARSYAGVYKRRGKLIPQPCRCGSLDVQMHHRDYNKPLEVEWLCKSCHVASHLISDPVPVDNVSRETRLAGYREGDVLTCLP